MRTANEMGGLSTEETTVEVTTTAITQNLLPNAQQPSPITPMYNLRGQRVDASYKGIVIIDGQKIVKK